MRAGRFIVFWGFADHSIGISDEEIVQGIFLGVTVEALKVIKLQFSIGSFSRLNLRQVLQLLRHVFHSKKVITNRLINLQIANVNLDVFCPLFALIENIAQSPRDQTSIIIAAHSSSHCERLTTTCLTIGEDGAIEAFQCGVDHIFCYFIEDLFLFGVHIKHLIELEGSLLFFIVYVAIVLILGDEKLCPTLFFIQICIKASVLKPLYTFLWGRTLRMMSIAEFLDIANNYYTLIFKFTYLFKSRLRWYFQREERRGIGQLVYQQIWIAYNNMGGQSTEFLRKIVDEFYAIRGVILSDDEGLHICSSFSPQEKKEQHQKFIQTTTLLISALNQTNGNLQKTKAYSQMKIVNFYYDEYLIHLSHNKHLIITLFMAKDTNVELAREISSEVLLAFEKLNAKVEDIRQHCN